MRQLHELTDIFTFKIKYSYVIVLYRSFFILHVLVDMKKKDVFNVTQCNSMLNATAFKSQTHKICK